MSSETITRNDLKAILEQCGMSGIAFQEAGILRVTGRTITNTSDAEIVPDNCNIYGDSDIFSTDGTYITVNKSCMCIALITLGISATADATKLKVLTICKRSASTEGLSTNAAGILNAWDVATATDIISLQEGDVISFCGRTHDSNCTLYNCRAVLIPIKSDIDTTTYDLCPDYITVKPSSLQTLSSNDIVPINIDTIISSNGSKLTFDSTNHAIIIGKNVDFVEVSGTIYISTLGTAGTKNSYIYKNETQICTTVANLTTNYNSITTPTTIIPVTEGDSITLRAKSANGTTTVVANTETFLQVKVVDMSGAISVKLPPDYIIDEGTNGNWEWRKWNSGIAECWLKRQDVSSYAITTARGSMYSGDWLQYTFPITFLNEYPSVTCSLNLDTASYGVFCQTMSYQASVKVRGVSTASISATTGFFVNIYAIGRWK